MTPERWLSLKRVYQEAVGLDPDRRSAYLADACAGDSALRAEVDALLSAAEAAAGFIETPAAVLIDRGTSGAGRRIGARRLLQIGTGIVVAVLLLTAGVSLWRSRDAKVASVAPASIAVVPFADLSPGHDQESLSHGLTEKILDLLAKVPDLRVAARTSAIAVNGKGDGARAIAPKLNAILEGSVRKTGDRVRVTAQLVNAADGFCLWSETYERKLTDVLDLDQIGHSVVAAIRLKLFAGRRTPEPVEAETYAQ